MKIKILFSLICLSILCSCSSSSSLEEEKSPKKEDLTAVAFVQKEGIEVEISTENIPSGKGIGDIIILIQVIHAWNGMIASREEWVVLNSPLSIRDTVFSEEGYLYFYRNAIIKRIDINN